MKKLLLLLPLCLFVSIIAHTQSIVINGKVTDADTLMVLLRSINRSDTVFTTNGAFSINRELSYPEFFTLICIKNKQSIEAIKENNERKMRSIEDGVSREFFLEGGEVDLVSSFAGIKSTRVSLSKQTAQDTYNEFRKRFNPLVKMARTIIDSSYRPNKSDPEKKIFDMMYKRIVEIENEVAEQFVRENSDNAVGAYILYRYGRTDNFQQLSSLYKLFNPSLQATAYLKNIKDKINALASLKVGDHPPLFSGKDSKNKPVALSDFKGKYVVIDFWGSWCLPCISGFPKMRDYYKKYNDKIEFIGIACEDQEPLWREAIKKHDLKWPQLLNEKGANDIAVQYNVEAYPTKIVIGKDGKLMAIFTGETEAFYRALDSLYSSQETR